MTTSATTPNNIPTGATPAPFGPNFTYAGTLPDLTLTSSDYFDFHVHTHVLLTASDNAFGGRLEQATTPRRIVLPEPAVVLSIVVYTTYGMSCIHHQPPFEAAAAALDSLIKYGISISQHATPLPTAPLAQLLLYYAPYRPIDAYALAAHHQLEALAVQISSHLLAYDVSRISDDLAVKMGPLYLGRLYNLQRARLAALRNIVLRPPARHPVTPICDEEAQQQLNRVWAFASAEIVWNALPSTSTQALSSAFTQASSSITCPDCRASIQNRIQEVTTQWSAVKRTI
ncbi:hypothetical protein C8Q77DRAFT_812454 [Trametes polyzona]|nr:hypothetical protein C8Q77DRAFT_812454 [Trametes polyzona]